MPKLTELGIIGPLVLVASLREPLGSPPAYRASIIRIANDARAHSTKPHDSTYTKQQWIAKQARKHPDRVFTSLHQLIDGEWIREAHRRTRKDGAAGIDGASRSLNHAAENS